ncbi:MAG: hypothetical protein MUF10_04545 [Thermoanaerobaculaceae bacterium]|jgi:hypothetical protein|nr:hypothetical protein [Thermoanaerobaculaceae bacterium]
MRDALKVLLACLGGYVGSLAVAFVLTVIGIAVAGRGGATRAGHVMMAVIWLVVVVFALSAALVWVAVSRAVPGVLGRLLVVGAYVLALVPTLLVIATVEAVLFNR